MASVVSRQNEDENRREDGQTEGPSLAGAMIAAGTADGPQVGAERASEPTGDAPDKGKHSPYDVA